MCGLIQRGGDWNKLGCHSSQQGGHHCVCVQEESEYIIKERGFIKGGGEGVSKGGKFICIKPCRVEPNYSNIQGLGGG